jgi:phosphocarrier protein
MMLAASCGSRVMLYADGADENAAIDAIEDLIKRRFDEEE